jgi:hypothetical protein
LLTSLSVLFHSWLRFPCISLDITTILNRRITPPPPKMYIFKCLYFTITSWAESASKLYRPSDLRLSVKLVPTFAVRGCHVVSVKDPYGSIFGFLDIFLLIPLMINHFRKSHNVNFYVNQGLEWSDVVALSVNLSYEKRLLGAFATMRAFQGTLVSSFRSKREESTSDWLKMHNENVRTL